MDYLIDLYRKTDRQGPGDVKLTEMAFNMLDVLPTKPKILDIGCGSGKQTIALAKHIDCEIIAIDYNQCFLDELAEKIKIENLENKIKIQQASMMDLPFSEEQFDIIWSEGAIYIMGFKKGLQEWKKFLKPQGYIVVSEISWLRRDIPDEIYCFWKSAYPEITTISQNMRIIEENGYKPLGHLILPEQGWLDNYYLPLKKIKKEFLQQFSEFDEAKHLINNEFEMEIKLYKKYKDYYSYVFYIMEKI